MGRFSWETSELTTTDPAPASAPPRGFPISEFEARSERAQRLMAARGLDALLVTTEPDLRMPAADYARLAERLGNLEIADATDVVRRLRNIKSAAELAKIRYACQVTSLAYEALPSRARIGESEPAVCRRLRIDLLQRGADTSPYLIAASGPGGYDNIIMGSTDRVLGPGDDTPLEPGMVITIEPGMEFAPGKLMVHEENIAIADGPAELLSRRAPPEMPVIS